jgi:Tfp pilus assembly protein PilX
MSNRPQQAQRGAALLVALILVALLAVVALTLVTRATTEVDAVGAKRKYDKSVSCAEAGRQMLLSQFRVFGLDPTSLTLNTHVGDLNVYTGHYDQFGIRTVIPNSSTAAGSGVGVTDMANRLGAQLGGTSYRFTVVCADSKSSHQSEVEYDVRFGL